MCGIAGIISRQNNAIDVSEKIAAMSNTLRHRGPDGEGFMLAGTNSVSPYFLRLKTSYDRKDLPYIPKTVLSTAPQDAILAFSHRRLAIIDLSESGHQPMCDQSQNL